MTLPRRSKYIATALVLGASVSVPTLALGQTNPGNANLSTGSGAGTSPGVSPGSSPSGTQIGGGALGGATPSMNREIPDGSKQPGVNPGGGIDPVTGLPAALDAARITPLTREEVEAIDAGLLNQSRKIVDPANRAMSMQHVAAARISAHVPGDTRLDDARIAIIEGGQAAMLVEDATTRDIRLMILIRTALALADEQVREAKTDATEVPPGGDTKPWTARRRFDWLKKAEEIREVAANLALSAKNPTLRSEMLYRVVDNGARGSDEIARQVKLADSKRYDLKGQTDMLERMADRGLVLAANDAARIDKAIWRDRAMVAIAIAAAASEQYERGIEISRNIPQPEYRSDAMTRLAEAQARDGLSAAATQTYSEAAAAVASIPLADPRATIAGVLIDSLISVGRFDDARACIGFYPDKVRQEFALGTVAYNQGERRLSESANRWIDREPSPELRDTLRLRLNEGVLKSFERYRGVVQDASMSTN